MKKVLLFILLLAVTAGIGFALYYFFFRGAAEAPTEVNGNVNAPLGGGGLQPSVNGAPAPAVNEPAGRPGIDIPTAVAQGGLTKVTPVTSVTATSPQLTTSGAVNYFNRLDGKFYRVNADGTTSSLSNKVFFNVSEAKFDPAGNKAILEFPDGSNIFYDFINNRQVTLPQHWEDFDFSPAGNEIAAKSVGLDPNNRFLVVSNPDGTSARPVQELGENQDQVKVSWSPNNQIIATATTGQSFGVDRKEVYLLGKNQENFKSMVVEGLDFRPEWSPSGNQLLYSVAGSLSDWKPQLWIVDAVGDDIGKNRRTLNVNTWADKCSFASDNQVYCAVPNELQRGAGLQPALADSTPDTIYKIDLSTGLQTKIAVPEGGPTVGKMMVSPDGKTLYFTDKVGGILNQIRLKP